MGYKKREAVKRRLLEEDDDRSPLAAKGRQNELALFCSPTATHTTTKPHELRPRALHTPRALPWPLQQATAHPAATSTAACRSNGATRVFMCMNAEMARLLRVHVSSMTG